MVLPCLFSAQMNKLSEMYCVVIIGEIFQYFFFVMEIILFGELKRILTDLPE
jgi:hypothetical protein